MIALNFKMRLGNVNIEDAKCLPKEKRKKVNLREITAR